MTDVARKEAFEEFVFDIAMRLNMATKHDPLSATSPSRGGAEHRLDIGLEDEQKHGQFVDTLYLEQLKKKLRLMTDAEESVNSQVF